MCGVNNTWSLEESNIWRFVNVFDVRQPGLLLRMLLDHSRVFKLGRMARELIDRARTHGAEVVLMTSG